GAGHAAGRGGRGAGRRVVLAERRRAPVAAPGCLAASCRRRAASAGSGAERPVRRPVRLAESRRRAAPLDGQIGLLRPQGIPEGRPDSRRLTSIVGWVPTGKSIL